MIFINMCENTRYYRKPLKGYFYKKDNALYYKSAFNGLIHLIKVLPNIEFTE